MIDFRYHIVSLIAVFLALATGLVLGSTALNNMVLQSTANTADELEGENADLRNDLKALEGEEQASEEFVQTMAPKLLAGELTDQRVALVAAPGADDGQVKRIGTAVRQAGGVVTGTVTLDDNYIAKRRVGVLGGLTDTLAKTTKLDMPPGAVPAERAGYLLANALVTDDEAKLGKSDDTSTGTLTAFEEAKFLGTEGSPQKRASLAVVVGPETKYEPKRATAGNDAMIALAEHLDETGSGVTLTAPSDSTGSNGMVAAARGDDLVSKEVSTVDNLDAPPGYLVTVLALALDAGGEPGHWGSGRGADSVAPSPTGGQRDRP